jgi:hypothetical protein
MANRWRQGCQPYAPAALYPQVSLFLKIPGGIEFFNKNATI